MGLEHSRRANHFGNEQEAIGVSPLWSDGQPLGQGHRQHRARQLIIGHRRMAAVAGKQDLIGRAARQNELAVVQRTGDVSGIDAGPVCALRQALALAVRQTKPHCNRR